MANEKKPTVTEVIDDLLKGLNDLKNHDINGDGKVTIDDVAALVDLCLHGDEEAEDNSVFNVNGVTFKMVAVKGGKFNMGTTNELGMGTNEGPLHEVSLSDYMIGETQVTQELWKAVMGVNPSKYMGDLKRPVERVTWNDCQQFIAKLNQMTGKKFRLPTEAEWEYAARGGALNEGHIVAGCDIANIKNYAWYKSNSNGETHPVGQKLPNELGIYDMSGNVAEWVNDFYKNPYPSEAQTNPTGPASGSFRIYRGGGYSSIAAACRCAYRYPASPDYKVDFLGLRLVL